MKNWMKFATTTVLGVVMLGATGLAFAASQAKIAKAEAAKVALAKVPEGKIKSAELEHERGALVWSFDIAAPHTRDIVEVLVDAHTGKIVEVSRETPAQQQAEDKADAEDAGGSE